MTTVAIAGGFAKTQKRAIVSLGASGTVQAAVANKKLKIYAYSLQSRNDGMTIQFTDGNGGVNLTHIWTLNAREGVISPIAPPASFYFATSLGTALYAVISGAGTVDIDACYWDDDAV